MPLTSGLEKGCGCLKHGAATPENSCTLIHAMRLYRSSTDIETGLFLRVVQYKQTITV